VSIHDVGAPARQEVVPVLDRELVAELPEPMVRMVGYQFGWVDERGAAVTGAGGKGIRPALAVLSAEAVGGTVAAAARVAAVVELVHNFSLAHDDIIDGDTTRRHRPTLWAQFGVPTATLAGDALLALAVNALATCPGIDTGAASRLLGRALLELVDGQIADVAFETRDQVTRAEYMAMAAGKTAALIGCSCALGAMCAGASASTVRGMRQFGLHLGLAFQMVDDVLGIWGDPAVTGKPARSDLRSRKKTYPVVLALSEHSSPAREFAALYRGIDPLAEAAIEAAQRCLERARTRERTEAEVRRQLGSALRCLDAVNPDPHAVAGLTAVTHLVTDRRC